MGKKTNKINFESEKVQSGIAGLVKRNGIENVEYLNTYLGLQEYQRRAVKSLAINLAGPKTMDDAAVYNSLMNAANTYSLMMKSDNNSSLVAVEELAQEETHRNFMNTNSIRAAFGALENARAQLTGIESNRGNAR